MNKKNIFLIAALILPIISLIGLTVYKQSKIDFGTEIKIPIVGYDPRDLLSGHYLIYRLNFNQCGGDSYNKKPEYICLRESTEEGFFSQTIPSLTPDDSLQCDTVIKGRCERGRFKAGIERFYIPEEHGLTLDRIIRKGKGKLVVSVDENGKPAIKDLLINDRSWEEYISE